MGGAFPHLILFCLELLQLFFVRIHKGFISCVIPAKEVAIKHRGLQSRFYFCYRNRSISPGHLRSFLQVLASQIKGFFLFLFSCASAHPDKNLQAPTKTFRTISSKQRYLHLNIYETSWSHFHARFYLDCHILVRASTIKLWIQQGEIQAYLSISIQQHHIVIIQIFLVKIEDFLDNNPTPSSNSITNLEQARRHLWRWQFTYAGVIFLSCQTNTAVSNYSC